MYNKEVEGNIRLRLGRKKVKGHSVKRAKERLSGHGSPARTVIISIFICFSLRVQPLNLVYRVRSFWVYWNVRFS